LSRKRTHLNKSQRMQLKAFICVSGILLLLLLFLGKIVISLLHKEPEQKPEPEVHIPVMELYSNVWIMEADAEKIMVFRDGAEETYYYGDGVNVAADGSQVYGDLVREQIADITLSDGKVDKIEVKQEKVNGKILSADADGVEIEGMGKLPLAKDYKGYRIFNILEMCTIEDLPFGYDFADLVLDNGQICALLLAKEEAMEYIRVLIKASDYSGLLHEEVTVTSDSDFTVQYGSYDNLQYEEHPAGEEIVIGRDSEYLAGGRVSILPKVITGKVILNSVNRNQGIPSYRGHMELVGTNDGIAVINQVTLEEYLYSVVPSEMPSSYPEEALKAQAICARTYAYGHMLHAGYPEYGAHVDDSTSYQVYNNILEQESTTTAAKGTYGQLLFTEGGALAGTYYYSTSCGVGTDAKVWKTEAAQNITYLKAKALNKGSMQWELSGEADAENGEDIGVALQDEEAFAEFIAVTREDDFEVAEGWYRWKYQVESIDTAHMLEVLQKRYNANEKLVLTQKDEEFVSEPIEELEQITDLYVEKRGVGGIADELIIETKKHIYKVISEHNIRYVLNDGESKIHRQDGSKVASPNLLPSGFFILEPEKENDVVTGYSLNGGGFGHGVGMSQNGARSMAKCGYTSEQILLFFYENCYIANVYE